MQGRLRPRAILAPHLQLLNDTWGRIEHWLAVANMQTFDARVIEVLEKFDEATPAAESEDFVVSYGARNALW